MEVIKGKKILDVYFLKMIFFCIIKIFPLFPRFLKFGQAAHLTFFTHFLYFSKKIL